MPRPDNASAAAFTADVVVIGGCGHVGLPLAIALADSGASVLVYDVSAAAVGLVNDAVLPFDEPGSQDKLKAAVSSGALRASTDPSVVGEAENVVVVIGTPVDEHLNPDPQAIPRALQTCSEYFSDGQLLILRSTVFPGVTELIERMLAGRGLKMAVAFCPERIAEGRAMTELYTLPQIVSGRDQATRDRAAAVFGRLTDTIVELEPEEAELAKLFTNTWRYIKFAAVNQFYTIADSKGLDFERIRTALAQDYPRAADMPSAGFAAGPCLFKDTMQLAAFNDNNFGLGHAAMLVNEGLPLYVVSQLAERHDLASCTVGILGASFKAGSDDIRSSLAYKLKRILSFKAQRVLMTDPYVTVDPDLVPLDTVLAESDVLIVATPHPEYRSIVTHKPVADVWNVVGAGQLGMSDALPRVTVVIPAYNEGADIVPVLDRLLESVTLPCEVLVVVDFAEDTTIPVIEAYGAHEQPTVRVVVSDYGRGPAQAIRYGVHRAQAPVVVVTMADGCDDPRQIDELTRLVERGVVVAAASRYMPGGQQVGGPLIKRLLSKNAGRTLHWFARVGTRDATNSFKAYRRDFVEQVGIDSRDGFEIGLELTAKARRMRLPVAEIPTIWLDRPAGVSNFKVARWLPRYLHWYFFAYGPRLQLGQLPASTDGATQPTQQLGVIK